MDIDEDAKVLVRFTTTHAEYRVPTTAFSIPVKLTKYGLSEVINHLLAKEPSEPFDFLVKGRLLRTSLKKLLAQDQTISTEEIIVIEYIPAVSISDETKSTELPSWIGSIQNITGQGICAVGCYDGQLRFIDSSTLETLTSVSSHNEPIRAVATSKFVNMVATASKDQSIKCWNFSVGKGKQKKSSTIASDLAKTLMGHATSVESLTFMDSSTASKEVLLSGDWGGNIFGWDFAGSDDGVEVRKKSRHNSGASTTQQELRPAFTIKAHVQSISSICPAGSGTGNIISSSWDHSMKQWDVERQDCVATFTSSKVVTSMHYHPETRLLASSHPDGRVRVWDSRLGPEESNVGSFTNKVGSKQWVSQVQWNVQSTNTFASCDYDGTVRMWDLRSFVPVDTKEVHQGKVLCLEWAKGGSAILSGGSDCRLSRSDMVGNV